MTQQTGTAVLDPLRRSAYDDGDERMNAAAGLTEHLTEHSGEAEVTEVRAEGSRVGFSKTP